MRFPYAQERSLLSAVLKTVAPNDVWIGDRNLCVLAFLLGIAQRQAAFVIREHASLPQQPLSPLRRVGESETGSVWEQTVLLEQSGQKLPVRRVVVRLHQPTRDGDREIAILTNLPETAASGVKVAELYRKRWTVETFFQVITTSLNCEIKTLGYPRAALFSFSMALLAYNVLSTLRAALRSVHGTGKIEAGLSRLLSDRRNHHDLPRHDDCHSPPILGDFFFDESGAIWPDFAFLSGQGQTVGFSLSSPRSEEEKEKAFLRPSSSSCLHGPTASPEKEAEGFCD